LYYNEKLFENAIIQFQKAKDKGMVSEDNYYYLAESYGSIGEDDKASKIYQDAFNKLYPSRSMYEKMGWLYFKNHDPYKGIEIVRKGLSRYRNNSGLLFMMGTLYSSVYNYDLSKKYYLDAIENSYNDIDEEKGEFNSILYYNLSLLEKSFLNYEEAYRSVNVSLNWKNRSSSHVELNMIYQDSLELKKAYEEIQKAISLPPETKFPHMSLVNVYIMSGRLDEAKVLVGKLLAETDFSWIVSFGITKDEYFAEIYKSLSVIYELKSNMINFNEENSYFNLIARPFRKIYYEVLNVFYAYKSANLFIKLGEQKIKSNSNIEGLDALYDGYERVNPGKTYKILLLANKLEEKTNPAKQKIYNIKKAAFREKSSFFFSKKMERKIINENIGLLDARWEKDILSDTLIELANSSGYEESREYIERLFFLNPSFLPLNNFKLNADVVFLNDDINNGSRNRIIKQLARRGIDYKIGSRVKINVDFYDYEKTADYFFNIYDRDDLIKNFRIKMDKSDKKYYEKLGLEFFNKMFIVDLN
jgi:hypothetical protein